MPLQDGLITDREIATGAIRARHIAVGAIKTASMSIVYTDWTPTFLHLTVGNGTQVARYARIGDFVTGYYRLVLGSTSVVGSATAGQRVMVSVPVPAKWINVSVGSAEYLAPAEAPTGIVRTMVGSWFYPSVGDASGAYVQQVPLKPTVPFTWLTDHMLVFSFTYEAA